MFVIKYLISIFLLFCLSSCSEVHAKRQEKFKIWTEDNGKIKALTTIAMIEDLVKHIGGEYVDTMTLIQGDLDPHSYQLVKGDDEKLNFAQLIFSNGLELEHGPSLQHYLRQNPKNKPLGNYIYAQDPNLIIQINGQFDPHIWMDMSLWARSIPAIVEALSEKDPAHRSIFEANGKQLADQLGKTHQEIVNVMHSVPATKRYLVTSHDAFNYFARAYLSEEDEPNDWQKRFVSPEGLSPESQLSVADIRAIIDHMDKYEIHVLFPESNVSQDSIQKILQAGREKGLNLIIACCPLYADAMGPPGSEGDTYSKMLLYNANMIASYLKKNGGIHIAR